MNRHGFNQLLWAVAGILVSVVFLFALYNVFGGALGFFENSDDS